MKIKEYKETIKKGDARTLWKQHMNNEIYLTHVNIYNENNWNKKHSILIYGHLHIPFIKEHNNNLFINPGSISLPKENNNPTYLIYDNNTFTIYDINDKKIVEKTIN